MENIKFKENFNNCRTSIYKPETRQFLLSRIAGSEQETDMSVPSNCDGFGRIHHFRRNVDKWVQDPLPNDPVCKALEIPYTDVLEAQVFQIASCKVYIIFTVEQVIQYMNCGRDKAMKTLAELDTKKGIGLIERVKQGFGKPDIIYVKNFILRTSKDVKNNDESEESIQQNREVEEVDLSESEKSTYRGRKNRLQGVGKTDFKRSENTTYRGRKIRTTEVGKIDPINTKYNYTDISNTDRNNTDLINLSDSSEQQSMDLMEEMELFQMNTALVKRNIEYDCLVQRCRLGEQQQLDEIVALIVETISIERENITISGVKYPYQFVKSRLLLLEESHIEYVLDCLHENTREVKNIKAYLLTCLMNSITTIGNYYQAKVNHDMYGGGI